MQEDRTIYSTPFKNDPGFVFHDSFILNFLRIWEHCGAEEACKYIKAIGLYGLGGDKPDENDSVWMYGLDFIFSMIDTDLRRNNL